LKNSVLALPFIFFFASNVFASGRIIKLSVYQSVSCQSPGTSDFQNSTKTEDVSISEFERAVIFNVAISKETLAMALQTSPVPDGKIKLDYTPWSKNGPNYTQGTILIDSSGNFSKVYSRFRVDFENSQGKGYCSYQLIFSPAH
jgi:hypothetical protein